MTRQRPLQGLLDWLDRSPWLAAYNEVMEAHFGPVCEEFDVGPEDIAQLLGEQHYFNVWGCAFEDFLSCNLPGYGNVVDDYLKRRGWKESPGVKAYLRAMRDSHLSVYEVSAVVPGQSMQLRDLLEERTPVTVTEHTATRSLKQWDRIAARVLFRQRRAEIGGGLLWFDYAGSEEVRRIYRRIRDTTELDKQTLAEELRVSADSAIAEVNATGGFHSCVARLVTQVWLTDALDRTSRSDDLLWCNSDGETLRFATVQYALTEGTDAGAVRAALDRSADLEAKGDDVWNWVGTSERRPARTAAPQGREVRELRTESESGTVLATLELKDEGLVLSADSDGRTARARALVEPLLGALVEAPRMSTQSVEDLMADFAPQDRKTAELPLGPEEERQMVHDYLDRHYREVLDTPVAMLNDLTPRAAAAHPETRQQAADWLKFLENANARQPADDPIASYDVTWMWEELGLSDLRR